MEAHLIEMLGMLLRWLHVIAGIAWVGSSFYFVWLDDSIEPPPPDSEEARKGVSGELWAVHGGGFYNPQKYAVAPARLPDKLHWFKWEAYTTWLSGTALLVGSSLAATAGLCSIGMLYGVLSVGTRFRETILPLLLLPVAAPVLLGAVGAIDCVLEETIERHGVVIAIGRVVDVLDGSAAAPLIHFRGAFLP